MTCPQRIEPRVETGVCLSREGTNITLQVGEQPPVTVQGSDPPTNQSQVEGRSFVIGGRHAPQGADFVDLFPGVISNVVLRARAGKQLKSAGETNSSSGCGANEEAEEGGGAS